MLSDFEFKSAYSRLEHDIASEFYIPCMENSIRYDRISGYFGSTVYIIAWTALKTFIENGGKIRVLCSPYISEDDATAISVGMDARTNRIIRDALINELGDMLQQNELSTPSRLLACLIATGIIEIRLVLSKSNTNPTITKLFHDKAGVFTDAQMDMVGFRGSFNETFKGLSDDGNVESVDVFQSWDGGKEAERVKTINDIFDNIWNKRYDNIGVYTLPQEVEQFIKDESSGYNWKDLLEEIKVTKTSSEKWNPNPSTNKIRLKKHQTRALDGWAANGYRAIYQGCTGCGKTVIAISAIRHKLLEYKSVLVIVPSKILLYHWQAEIRRILNDLDIRFLLCGDGNNSWRTGGTLRLWTSPSRSRYKVTIAIMDTAINEDFISQIYQGEHLFVVIDEVHRMGSPGRQKFFIIDAGARLGLSATPIRYGDPSGTNAIINYFSKILSPPYTLENALNDKVLTPYFYHPESIVLTPAEQEKWDAISREISRRYAIAENNGGADDDTFLHLKMIQRARIIKKAENKRIKALEIIRNNYREGQKWLVYCEDQTQLYEINSMLISAGYDSYVYFSEMSGGRGETLDYFRRNGGILVSIKCLDEGVDIPATTHALILASSKNPREFIQRRGRVLRKADKKYFSHLYDVIAVPNMENTENDKSLSIVLSELSRAIEFGRTAENPACISDLKRIAIRYNVDYNKAAEGGYEDEE